MEDRLFEYIAATNDHGTTKVPGPESFTRALISALKALLFDRKDGRFTTDKLLRNIKTCAPGFPKDQMPVMANQGIKRASGGPAGRIMLHPLRKHRSSGVAQGDEYPFRAATGYVMTLHIHFRDKPLDDHLVTLGRALCKTLDRKTFGVHQIRWGGIKETPFVRAVRKFQDILDKLRASRQSQRPQIMLPHSPSSSDYPGLSDPQEPGCFQNASDTASDSDSSQGSVATYNTPLTSESTSAVTDDSIQSSGSVLSRPHKPLYFPDRAEATRILPNDGTSECPLCATKFEGTYQHRKSNLSRHLRYKHGSERRYKCTVSDCDREYHRSDDLIKHQHKRHPEMPLNSEKIQNSVTGNVARPMKNDAPLDREARLTLSELRRPTALIRPSTTMSKSLWLYCENLYRRHIVRESSISRGKTRIRWTCVSLHRMPNSLPQLLIISQRCGKSLYDDFEELRPGAARDLEIVLNQPSQQNPGREDHPTHGQQDPAHPSDEASSGNTVVPSGHTTITGGPSPGLAQESRPDESIINVSGDPDDQENSWLLVCASERQRPIRLSHLDVFSMRSDYQLLTELRRSYTQLKKAWYHRLSLRNVKTIKYIRVSTTA